MNSEETNDFNHLLQLKFYDAVEEWKERNVTIVEDITWDKLLDEFHDELDSICPPDMLDPVTQSYMKNPRYILCGHRFDKSTLDIIQEHMHERKVVQSCPLCRYIYSENGYYFSAETLDELYERRVLKLVYDADIEYYSTKANEYDEWEQLIRRQQSEHRRALFDTRMREQQIKLIEDIKFNLPNKANVVYIKKTTR
jgi:hypothetical protein